MAYNYKKKKFDIIQSAAGAALLVLGIFLAIFSESKTADFAIILGGTFCFSGLLSIGVMRLAYTPKENEQETRKESIESTDERSRTIREKSGWATQRVMLVVLCVFVALVTFVLPFNITTVVAGWCLLIANAVLPYLFAYLYSKRC